jgi:hypothetical protein
VRNCIAELEDGRGERGGGPQPIGVILAELLAQYERRFPEARIGVVEAPAAPLVMEDYHACACST